MKTSVFRSVVLIGKIRVGCQWVIFGFVFLGVENTHFQAEGDSWWFGGSPCFGGAWEKVICWFGIRGRLGDCSWLQIMKVFKFDVIYRFYVTCALGIIWGGDGFES